MTVIDFFGFCEAPVPVDILCMLVYLESIGHGIANSGSRIRTLRNRFLAGLGPLPAVPTALVLLCEAQHRIQQIAGAALLRKGGGRQRPVHWAEDWERSRALAAHVNWFLVQRERPSLWPSPCRH